MSDKKTTPKSTPKPPPAKPDPIRATRNEGIKYNNEKPPKKE